MKKKMLLAIAFHSIRQHTGRSSLTILGIIIGIAAIISTFAIGRGAEKKIEEQVRALGDNFIVITSRNWTDPTKQSKKKYPITFKDMRILVKQSLDIKKISPIVRTEEEVCFENNRLFVPIKGGNEDCLSINNRDIKKGVVFNAFHVSKGSRVAVLGSRAARDLFKWHDPINKTILIKKVPFTVIGVLDSTEHLFGGVMDPNHEIFVPFSSVKKHLFKKRDKEVHFLVVSAKFRETVPQLIRQIRRILRQQRHLEEKEPDNFMILDQQGIGDAAKKTSQVISFFVLIAASIALLVAGIGVMNIMLIAVTERTREIGIRLALGATKKIIQLQFLFEAVCLCVLGGVIGVFFGIVFSLIIKYLTKYQPILELFPIIVAFIITSVIGIFFGYYPAYKASNLKPVDALREE